MSKYLDIGDWKTSIQIPSYKLKQ
jgi:hypothetical protein